MASRTASALLLLLFLFSNCRAGSDSDATASGTHDRSIVSFSSIYSDIDQSSIVFHSMRCFAAAALSSGHNAGRRRTVVAEISKPVRRGGSGRSSAGGSSSARGQGGSLGQPSARGSGSVAAARPGHRSNAAGCANHFHRHFAITFLFSWLLLLMLLLW